MSEALREAARAIFAAALQAVDIKSAVQREINVQPGILTIAGRSLPIAEVDRVLIVAIGKAAVPMFAAAQKSLIGLPVAAVVVAPIETHPATPLQPEFSYKSNEVQYFSGSHPTPDVHSAKAARSILNLLNTATDRTVVLFLISGGASAMIEQPLDPRISLQDIANFHRALVASGLNITQMNTLRKHISAVKGGRLATAAARARMQCSLLISDVPAAAPDAIASGPSLPDTTTVADCLPLFDRLKLSPNLPISILEFFSNPQLPETPKPQDAAFARAHYKVILSSDHLALAAQQAALAANFHATIDNTPDDWDYREAAEYLLNRSAALSLRSPRACLISVGEVSVTLPPTAGEGGRNQQMALWCAEELARRGREAAILCAGSDGIDGHSTAAGAVCDDTTIERAAAAGYSLTRALHDFHASPLLHTIGDSIVTGPTGNNLRDLRLILTEA